MRNNTFDVGSFSNSYNICICEGAAEEVIINLLLDHDKLIFSRDSLLRKKVERTRSATKITQMYLNQDYAKDVSILRILDSRTENFKLRKIYIGKFPVYNIYTRPEIEMLIIINEGHFQQFSQRAGGEKPSEYCKRVFGMGDVKSQDFIRQYFDNIDKLVNAIKMYRQFNQGGEHNLSDLLKE